MWWGGASRFKFHETAGEVLGRWTRAQARIVPIDSLKSMEHSCTHVQLAQGLQCAYFRPHRQVLCVFVCASLSGARSAAVFPFIEILDIDGEGYDRFSTIVKRAETYFRTVLVCVEERRVLPERISVTLGFDF